MTPSLSLPLSGGGDRRRDPSQQQRSRGWQAVGWFPGFTWNITCAECELRHSFTTEDAVRQFGANYLLINLAFDSIMCPKRRDHRTCNAKLKSDDREVG